MSDEQKPADVKQILAAWLREHSYDGLCNSDLECGCGVDAIAPCAGGVWGCQGIPEDCEPACRREVEPDKWLYVADWWVPEEEEEE